VFVDAGDHLRGSKHVGNFEGPDRVPGYVMLDTSQEHHIRINHIKSQHCIAQQLYYVWDSVDMLSSFAYMLAAIIGTPVHSRLLLRKVYVLSNSTCMDREHKKTDMYSDKSLRIITLR
jgi:hypothetical protein